MAWGLAPMAHDLPLAVRKAVLVDVNPDLAASSAERLGWESSSDDWRKVLVSDEIDVVDIVTPPQFHADIAMEAMRAGKHVFCEKPLSNRIEEAVELARVAAQTSVVTQVGFNYRQAAPVAFGKQLLDSGRLGRPLEFRGSYLNESGFTGAPDRWRARRSSGGSGATGDIGSHVIDIAQHLLGPITRVSALVRSRTKSDDGWGDEAVRLGDPDIIDDTSLWIAEFASGAIGSFSVSSFASGRKNRVAFELDAEEGAFEFDWNDREQFRVSYVDDPEDHSGFRVVHTNLKHPNGVWRLAGLGTGYADVSALQFAHFVRAIAGEGPAAPDFADAAQVQLVVEAVYESARTGQWVSVPAIGAAS
jgi:predicted dehydrogenase